MISKISGKVTDKFFDSLIVDVGGVGYEVYVPNKVFTNIYEGESYSFYTTLYVSKDMEFKLYGFLAREDIDFFKMLNSVSGVGPKTAFTILSAKEVKQTKLAISNADKSFFKDVSGVGPKMAMKIILELQDKVGKQKELEVSMHLSAQDREILDAVKSMGYDVARAQDILESLNKDIPENEKIKLIISTLSK